MRRRQTRHSLGTVAELNVTPLLDLAFVLLIIFMITAPFLAESADLIIPTSRASRDAVDPEAIFTISIRAGGEIDLNGEPMTLGELPAGLALLRKANPDLAALVRAHRDISIERLIAVMDALKASGVAKVGVMTKPDDGS